MARRPSFHEPVSRLAAWSNRCALFAFVVAALSIVVVRSGTLEILPSLATFGAALVFAGLAVLLALAAFVVIWRHGLSGLGRALSGLLLGLALLAYPAYLGARAIRQPAITDVSTDPGNPPRFEALQAERPRAQASLSAADAAARQRTAYPDVTPLQLSVPPRVAYEVALGIVTKNKWQVAGTRAPTAARRDALIEATARTPIMGLREDIAIRVTPLGQGSRVDIRSAARFGFHDLGANVARVRILLDDIEDAASNAPPAPPEPEPKAAPKRPERKPPERRR
jgi:hypothetical protein